MGKASALAAFGNEIRAARERSGLSQLSLGLQLGFKSGQFISSLECGRRTLPAQHVSKIAKILSLKESDLIERLILIEKERIQEMRVAC